MGIPIKSEYLYKNKTTGGMYNMKKWICRLLNNYLKKNEDIGCEVLMEIFQKKYGDKIFLIDQIDEAKKNSDQILLSNGVILDFSNYTMSRIE